MDRILLIVNPAIASQSLAIAGQAVNGGAIALGHPLGCTGAKLSVQLFNEMRRRKQKYGVVTIPLGRDKLCVGTGQGVASVFELLN